MFFIVNMIVILDSYVTTMVNFMDSDKNRKNKNERSYRISYVWEL